MTTPEIIPIKTGFVHSFLIKQNNNCILVDAGVKNHIHTYKNSFSENHILPNQIKLIVLTHTHYDHSGNVNELKNAILNSGECKLKIFRYGFVKNVFER